MAASNGLIVKVLFGALGALIVLAFVFASLLAFLPLARGQRCRSR